jgi:transcriptional regulator with XRE-family HTH domain
VSQTEYAKQHELLAEQLRSLRRASGITAAALGECVGLSQSTVSRYESGKLTAGVQLVDAWCNATNADADTRHDLVGLARTLATEFNSWRMMHKGGFSNHQSEIAALEARANVIRIYQQSIVPGLLQTAEYARRLLAKLPVPPKDIGAALAARLERQTALYDTGKRFEFAIAEAALQAQVCDAQTLRAQWDRLSSLISLPNVGIRVLPSIAELSVVPATTFVMFGEELVIVETLTAETFVRDPRDIETYARTFASLASSALGQAESAGFIKSLLLAGADTELTGAPSGGLSTRTAGR